MTIIKNNILRIGFNFLDRKQGEGVADDPNGSHRVYESTEQCQKKTDFYLPNTRGPARGGLPPPVSAA